MKTSDSPMVLPKVIYIDKPLMPSPLSLSIVLRRLLVFKDILNPLKHVLHLPVRNPESYGSEELKHALIRQSLLQFLYLIVQQVC